MSCGDDWTAWCTAEGGQVVCHDDAFVTAQSEAGDEVPGIRPNPVTPCQTRTASPTACTTIGTSRTPTPPPLATALVTEGLRIPDTCDTCDTIHIATVTSPSTPRTRRSLGSHSRASGLVRTARSVGNIGMSGSPSAPSASTLPQPFVPT